MAELVVVEAPLLDKTLTVVTSPNGPRYSVPQSELGEVHIRAAEFDSWMKRRFGLAPDEPKAVTKPKPKPKAKEK